jgi:serine/threonine-protein kinase
VARQDPEQNTKLEKGKTIGYWISSGEGKVEVPDVTNMDQTKAAAALVKLGLEFTTKPEVNTDVAAGTVLRQNPEAGRKVDAGTTVTLTIAAVSNTIKVPYLIGMMKDNASASLQSMNLTPVIQEVTSDQPGGTVVDQDPKSGAELKPGDKVTVFVSNAPVLTTVQVPAVAQLGLTESQAKARLALFGLKARVIDLETPDSPPGQCIYQSPAAGKTVKIGSVVEITIAREPVTTTTTTAPPATTTTTAPPATTTTTPPST